MNRNERRRDEKLHGKQAGGADAPAALLREVLERSLDGSAPYYAVARFLEAYDGPVDIHWSPA